MRRRSVFYLLLIEADNPIEEEGPGGSQESQRYQCGFDG
jgi:hypothetical protein